MDDSNNTIINSLQEDLAHQAPTEIPPRIHRQVSLAHSSNDLSVLHPSSRSARSVEATQNPTSPALRLACFTGIDRSAAFSMLETTWLTVDPLPVPKL
jgi:hypothetical protein